MGRGGDASFAQKRNFSFDKLKNLSSVKDDLTVLRHMWFGSKKGDDHAARLESFYGPQAAACEFGTTLAMCAYYNRNDNAPVAPSSRRRRV